MASKSQPTEGVWRFHRQRHHQVISDTGASVCTVHKGNRHNGPIIAVAKDAVIATALLLNDVRRLRQGQPVPNIVNHINQAEALLSRSKGETE